MLVDALLRGGPEMGPPEEEVVETSGSTKLGDGDGVEWYVREYSNAIVMERPRRGVIRGITVP